MLFYVSRKGRDLVRPLFDSVSIVMEVRGVGGVCLTRVRGRSVIMLGVDSYRVSGSFIRGIAGYLMEVLARRRSKWRENYGGVASIAERVRGGGDYGYQLSTYFCQIGSVHSTSRRTGRKQ